jgi:hypothetical protein
MKGVQLGTKRGTFIGLRSGLKSPPSLGLSGSIIQAPQAETLAWFDQLPLPKPSGTFFVRIDFLIRNLKQFGIWNNLDRFWIFATEQQSHAKVSLVNPNGISSAWPTNISEVNSPKWGRNLGYTFNGSSNYLNSNYNPSSQGVNYKLNNASLGFYSYSNGSGNSNTQTIGSYDGTNLIVLFYESTAALFLNSTSGASVSVSNYQSILSGSRTSSSTANIYQRGSLTTSGSENSSAIPNLNLFIGARNNSGTAALFDPRTLSMAFIGSGNINQALLYNIFQRFALQMGFYV